MEKERGIKITNVDKSTNKNGVLHIAVFFICFYIRIYYKIILHLY